MISIRKLVTVVPAAGALAFLIVSSVTSARPKGEEVTFARDVAPILFHSCARCHRPGDIAPFSVLSYADVRPWARSIREKVLTREMPPWHADPSYGEFRNDPSLGRKEIATIVKWVDQGARQGDPKYLPPAPAFSDDWEIGAPDQVFSMLEDYTIKSDAPDDYINYTIPTRFKEDRWIEAAEIRPGNKRVVHHAIAHILTPQTIARAGKGGPPQSAPEKALDVFYKEGSLSRIRMDAPVIDDGANAANGGSVISRRAEEQGSDLFSILLASYAPGKGPDVYGRGMGKKIPAGSVIVLQIHYSTFRGAFEKAETDRTSVGLIFAKEPPAKRVVTLTVPNHLFMIPPGAENHRVTASYTFDQDVELIDYMPHMHLRGKDMKYEVIYPDNRREALLWVPAFNFNWQTIYYLKKPVPIPRGSKVIITAHFDNSARNKYNPNPARAVRWGDPTYDEMMIGWLDYAVPNANSRDANTGRTR